MDKLERKDNKEPVKGKEELMHGFKTSSNSFFTPKLLGLLLLVVFIGVGSGYFLAGNTSSSSLTPGKRLLGSGVDKGKVYGEENASDFEENAPEGVLKQGGIEDEGQFHLVRPADLQMKIS